MNPAQIVTIREKQTLYKGDTPAERIELIKLEETDFDVVAQKDLYKVGDKAVYIQPDYCVSDISLFESFIRPGGDESKSMLGRVGGEPRRIRAKKFAFSKEPNGDHVYSNGIMMPYEEVFKYTSSNKSRRYNILELENLTELLQITKYEEPEVIGKGGLSVNSGRAFPSGVYKTDEDNYRNVCNRLKFPVHLFGSEKVDGSSITIGVTHDYPEGFICSRNLLKPFMIKKHVGRREKTLIEKILFWTKPNLNQYEEVENDDDFIRFGKPYLEVLKQYEENCILRGELHGGRIKGSGNKNNPASQLKEPAISFFGVDYFDTDIKQASRCTQEDLHNIIQYFNDNQSEVTFNIAKVVFDRAFESKEELETLCDQYFKQNMIEGIVIRTRTGFSCKYMNNEYDSKK